MTSFITLADAPAIEALLSQVFSPFQPSFQPTALTFDADCILAKLDNWFVVHTAEKTVG